MLNIIWHLTFVSLCYNEANSSLLKEYGYQLNITIRQIYEKNLFKSYFMNLKCNFV